MRWPTQMSVKTILSHSDVWVVLAANQRSVRGTLVLSGQQRDVGQPGRRERSPRCSIHGQFSSRSNAARSRWCALAQAMVRTARTAMGRATAAQDLAPLGSRVADTLDTVGLPVSAIQKHHAMDSARERVSLTAGELTLINLVHAPGVGAVRRGVFRHKPLSLKQADVALQSSAITGFMMNERLVPARA